MGVHKSSSPARRLILVLAVGAFVAFGLGSCQLLGITKLDRLSQFGADLSNPDKSGMSANFAQGQTADYGIMNDQLLYWDLKGFFLPLAAEPPYSIVVHDYVDPSNVTADIYGPAEFYNFYSPVGASPVPAVIVLAQIGTDWFIKSISVNGTPPQTIQ
jgi:hypothetical protein